MESKTMLHSDNEVDPPGLHDSKGNPARTGSLKTQIVMIGMWILALIIAIANYLMFKFLDGRVVDDVLIPQSYIGAASVALAFLFKASLVTSLWSAFTQWLWHILRQKKAKISTIDSLTRILFDAMSLLNLDAFRFQPMLYLCAVLCWGIAVTTIFPPGALIVRSQPVARDLSINVPVYDPLFRGDNTMLDMQTNALFTTNEIGQYFIPKPTISGIAKQSILLQKPLSIPSPCGENCTYSVQIPGPSYDCRIEALDGSYARAIQGSQYIFLGNRTISGGNFCFEATWYPTSSFGSSEEDLSVNILQNISCNAWASLYTFTISYKNGIQDVRSTTTPLVPLPADALDDEALFYHQAIRNSDGTLNLESMGLGDENQQGLAGPQMRLLSLTAARSNGSLIFSPEAQAFKWNDSILLPPGLQNISTAFEFSNIRAIHDAVSQSLAGGGNSMSQNALREVESLLQSRIEESFRILGRDNLNGDNNTQTSLADNLPPSMVLESSMATFSSDNPTAVNLTITADALNALLSNTTISLLTMPNTHRVTTARTQDNANTYIFARPLNLILPYALTLGCAAVVVVIGLRSLRSNGTPATMGGFMQVLCTTRGSQRLDELAISASVDRATQDDVDRLGDLRVRLGRIERVGVTGFGTATEISLSSR